MFFSASEKPQGGPDTNTSHSNSTAGGGPNDIGFYIYFYLHNAINGITVLMNFSVTIMIIWNRKKSFATPFYGLTALLMFILFIVGVVSMIHSIMFMGLGVRSDALDFTATVTGLYTSYYSVILIWLLGLNRMAIFTMPRINMYLFTRNKLIFALTTLTIFMIFVTMWLYETIGIGLSSSGTTTASNLLLLHIVNAVSYCIPLSSCFFYIRLYLHLRKNRRQTTAQSVKETFSKAETATATQGIVILTTYLLCVVVHIAMQLIPRSGPLRLYMNGFQDIVESMPQLIIPISTIRCVAQPEDFSVSTTHQPGPHQ